MAMLRNKENNKYIDILQKMPVAGKLISAFKLFDLARGRIAGEIKRQNPDLTTAQLNKMVQERFYK